MIARTIHRASHLSMKKHTKSSRTDQSARSNIRTDQSARCNIPTKFPTNFAKLLCNPFESSNFNAPINNKTRLMLRISPLNCKEQQSFMKVNYERGYVTINQSERGYVTVTEPTNLSSFSPPISRPSFSSKLFSYDSIFAPSDNLEKICSDSIPNLIRCVLDGSNACVFSYGHTRLGKTFTMIGLDDHVSNIGLIPFTIGCIFRAVNEERLKTGERYSLRVSAIEVSGRNEQITDLLASYSEIHSEKCAQFKELFTNGVQMDDVLEQRVTSAEQAGHFFDAAIATRKIPETKDEIRNCHFIFTIHLYHYRLEADSKGQVTGGRSSFHLLDLGSCGRSGDGGSALNLSSLGVVITALLNGQRHVPYRDSKLALILKTILGNSECHATGIIHVSPLVQHAQESLQLMQLCSKMNRGHKPKRRTKELARSGVRMGTWQRASDYTSSSEQSSQCSTVIYAGPSSFRSDQASTTDDSTVISIGRSSGRLSSSSRACSNKPRRLKPVLESCMEGTTLSKKDKLNETWIDGPQKEDCPAERWIDGPAELRSQLTSVKPSVSKIVKVPSLADDRTKHSSKSALKGKCRKGGSKTDEDVIAKLISVRAEEKTMAWVTSLTQFEEDNCSESNKSSKLNKVVESQTDVQSQISLDDHLKILRTKTFGKAPHLMIANNSRINTNYIDGNKNVEIFEDFNANDNFLYNSFLTTTTNTLEENKQRQNLAELRVAKLRLDLLNGRESIYELQMDGELERGSSRESLVQLYYASDEDGSLWGTMNKALTGTTSSYPFVEEAEFEDEIKINVLNGNCNEMLSMATTDVSLIEKTIKNLYFSETQSKFSDTRLNTDDNTTSSNEFLPPPLDLSFIFNSDQFVSRTPLYEPIHSSPQVVHKNVSFCVDDDDLKLASNVDSKSRDKTISDDYINLNNLTSNNTDNKVNIIETLYNNPHANSCLHLPVENKSKMNGIFKKFRKSTAKSGLPVSKATNAKSNCKSAAAAASDSKTLASKNVFLKHWKNKERINPIPHFERNKPADKCNNTSPSIVRSLALTSPYSRITQPKSSRGCGSESGCSSALTSASGRTKSNVVSEFESSGYDSNSKEEVAQNLSNDFKPKKFRSKSVPSKWTCVYNSRLNEVESTCKHYQTNFDKDVYNIGHLSLRCQHDKLNEIQNNFFENNQDDELSKPKNIIKCFDCLSRTDTLKLTN